MDLLSFWWSIIENESMRDSMIYEICWSWGDGVIDNELWEFYEVEYIMLFGIIWQYSLVLETWFCDIKFIEKLGALRRIIVVSDFHSRVLWHTYMIILKIKFGGVKAMIKNMT